VLGGDRFLLYERLFGLSCCWLGITGRTTKSCFGGAAGSAEPGRSGFASWR
jgi:hypothetical protein